MARNLVRGSYQATWSASQQLAAAGRINLPRGTRWVDRVPMQIAANTDPARLLLIAWLQNANGEVVAIAQATCFDTP